ncbi:MAG TPA: hypothetical protein VK625_00145, partial [Flavitalea sp.]|nr:hypothetical protein [Flavitalea sp.]
MNYIDKYKIECRTNALRAVTAFPDMKNITFRKTGVLLSVFNTYDPKTGFRPEEIESEDTPGMM